jgi:hypothetical protein
MSDSLIERVVAAKEAFNRKYANQIQNNTAPLSEAQLAELFVDQVLAVVGGVSDVDPSAPTV